MNLKRLGDEKKKLQNQFHEEIKKHEAIADTMHIIEKEIQQTADNLENIDEELIKISTNVKKC